MKDVFIISAEAEALRVARLMNKASREYWKLKDRRTEYAKMLHACYYMYNKVHESVLETIREYKRNLITQDLLESDKIGVL